MQVQAAIDVNVKIMLFDGLLDYAKHNMHKNKMFQLPPFAKKDPDFWLIRIDSVFKNHGLIKDELKFSYMLAQASEDLVPYVATASKKTPISGQTKYTVFKEQDIKSLIIFRRDQTLFFFQGPIPGE